MSASGQTILLVEDNEDDIELTVHAFSKGGMGNDIRVVRDGEAALEFLRCHDTTADLPDMVLLDLKLPGIGGLEVLRRMRGAESTRRLPVIILSTSDDERDIADGYDLGANSYVRKPVDFGRFTAVMNQLGLYWLTVNTPSPT